QRDVRRRYRQSAVQIPGSVRTAQWGRTGNLRIDRGGGISTTEVEAEGCVLQRPRLHRDPRYTKAPANHQTLLDCILEAETRTHIAPVGCYAGRRTGMLASGQGR